MYSKKWEFKKRLKKGREKGVVNEIKHALHELSGRLNYIGTDFKMKIRENKTEKPKPPRPV